MAENLLRTKGALLKNVFYSFASRDDLLARSGGTLAMFDILRMYGFSLIEMYECSKMKRVMDKLLSILSSRTLMDSNDLSCLPQRMFVLECKIWCVRTELTTLSMYLHTSLVLCV